MRRVIGIDVGTKNLAVCCVRCADSTTATSEYSIEHWAVLGDGQSAVGAVHALLERELDVPPGIDVVIERQPIKNPTMAKMQHYLEMYCASRGAAVHVQDSKRKLVYAATTPWWPADAPDKPSYHMRKKLAVAVTSGFVGAHASADIQKLFCDSKKKDDLADSFLHAVAFIQKSELK